MSSQQPGRREVTVASNIPDGDAACGPGVQGQHQRHPRTRQLRDFGNRNRNRARPGRHPQRLTVAVLVNGSFEQSMKCRLVTPFLNRGPTRNWTHMRELISAAVGFDEAGAAMSSP